MSITLPIQLPYLQKLSLILGKTLTFIDLETTGMVHEHNFSIIEIGLIHISKDLVIQKSSLVNPHMKIPPYISEITNIYDHMVSDKKDFSHFSSYVGKIAKNNIMCGYNSKTFDSKGMEKMLRKYSIDETFKNQLDFRHIFLRCRKNFDGILGQSGNLTQACAHHGIVIAGDAHRAAYDIAITALLAEKLLEKYGFGIIHKDMEKFDDSKSKGLYYNHIVGQKIKIIS
ncbi:3'-5' exonuclease [archaeon]|nr:3'-5' exonuclease [archaeon]